MLIEFFNERSKKPFGYFELLSMIDAQLVTPDEHGISGLYKPQSERRFWIRHDVDNHIWRAWEMAEEEARRGIKSVYFFLNSSPYFRWGNFLQIARDFVSAGHTIGLHNNSVALAYKDNNPYVARRILKRDLDYLRQAGPVWITASHGDIWCRRHNVLNYDMFSDCNRPGMKTPFPDRRPLAYFGLKYEAYFTPFDCYLSDSGGKWTAEDPLGVVDLFNQHEGDILQLLVHPEWWAPMGESKNEQ